MPKWTREQWLQRARDARSQAQASIDHDEQRRALRRDLSETAVALESVLSRYESALAQSRESLDRDLARIVSAAQAGVQEIDAELDGRTRPTMTQGGALACDVVDAVMVEIAEAYRDLRGRAFDTRLQGIDSADSIIFAREMMRATFDGEIFSTTVEEAVLRWAERHQPNARPRGDGSPQSSQDAVAYRAV